MNVELTSRSAAIIAREQSEHGAISPEQLIEQALESYAARTNWRIESLAELRANIEEGWEESERGETVSSEEGWAQIRQALKR